jgi:hypothetical protein
MANNQNNHGGDTNATTMVNQTIPIPASQQQLTLNSSGDHSHSSCSSCLWTGVITSFGLSAYFAHIAFDDVNPTVTTTTTPTNSKMIVHHQFSNTNSMNNSTNVFRSWFQEQVKKYHNSPRTYTHNKPVFLCISAGWAIVGVYRWYLG